MTQAALANSGRVTPVRGRRRSGTAVSAHGQPMVWLSGGSLVVALAMIAGLLGLIVVQGSTTFWPQPVVQVETLDGKSVMGEVARGESYQPGEDVSAQAALRRLIRTGNFELTGSHFAWVGDSSVSRESAPPWAMTVERQTWGRFYGTLVGFELDGKLAAAEPGAAWEMFNSHHGEVRNRWLQRRELERDGIGGLSRRQEGVRLDVRKAELKHGARSPEHLAEYRRAEEIRSACERESADIAAKIAELNRENDRCKLVLRTSDGQDQAIRLADIVRAYPANQLAAWGKLKVYASRWWEFLAADPREANSEGGVWPAIVGTLAMTIVMSLAVVPLGVLAALYLREYARNGRVVSIIRIAVNNLAGVPSIVFGVFGLGLFCYMIGGGLDGAFFAHKLPNPTLGKTAMLWASLTLAFLTLPVVIVATEESLAAVPNSMREGSYACGAGKWQTVRRIVLPRAMPGIMTGLILAVARAAGEVAPLMLVGAVKLAPDLPVDGSFPFVHLDRSFMHLGFHIFDLGFQSQNSEAAKPMVFTTTLLLIAIIFVLNLAAIRLRSRLARKFVAGQF